MLLRYSGWAEEAGRSTAAGGVRGFGSRGPVVTGLGKPETLPQLGPSLHDTIIIV